MTSEERKLLVDFLQQLEQVRGLAKDPEAEMLIGQTLRKQPDAAYLLVQKALLQGRALEAAQTRIAELEARQNQGRGQSFLGSDPWATRTMGPAMPFGGGSAFPAAPASSGMGGFLGTALATAAGIAGGAFLVQGIENLLGHHDGGLFGEESPSHAGGVENLTINEYYQDDEDAPDRGTGLVDFDGPGTDYDEYGDDDVSV